jgi:hypothetical protein
MSDDLKSKPVTVGDLLAAAKKRRINRATHVPMTHVYDDKLNAHFGKMNGEGWDLLTVFIEATGIEERFVMIWQKEV